MGVYYKCDICGKEGKDMWPCDCHEQKAMQDVQCLVGMKIVSVNFIECSGNLALCIKMQDDRCFVISTSRDGYVQPYVDVIYNEQEDEEVYSIVMRRVDPIDLWYSRFEISSQFLDKIIELNCETEDDENNFFECMNLERFDTINRTKDYIICYDGKEVIESFIEDLEEKLNPLELLGELFPPHLNVWPFALQNEDVEIQFISKSNCISWISQYVQKLNPINLDD